MRKILFIFIFITTLSVLFLSCGKKEYRSFSIAWSEYPSWSVFGVAGVSKINEDFIIAGAKGETGFVEKKWGVDIQLKEMDYDSCIVAYGSQNVDAVCITNMDILNPAVSQTSVAILPTSTSYGADACITSKSITRLPQLKGKNIYGLAKSVSEYCWVRYLQKFGDPETDYNFTNMDPGAAATAFQQGQDKFEAIVVWNPFVMDTLKKRKDSHVLFDSTKIPGEIIDMVVMSEDSLKKKDGHKAACAVIEAYYLISEKLASQEYGKDTLVALGEKFSNLNADEMLEVVQKTRFYATPEQGIALFTDGVVFPWNPKSLDIQSLFTNKAFNKKSRIVTPRNLKETMGYVVRFSVDHEMTPKNPVIGYGDYTKLKSNLVFDPQFMVKVAEEMK